VYVYLGPGSPKPPCQTCSRLGSWWRLAPQPGSPSAGRQTPEGGRPWPGLTRPGPVRLARPAAATLKNTPLIAHLVVSVLQPPRVGRCRRERPSPTCQPPCTAAHRSTRLRRSPPRTAPDGPAPRRRSPLHARPATHASAGYKRSSPAKGRLSHVR
jgi:hypothetical protein